jgi:hypothetical protein
LTQLRTDFNNAFPLRSHTSDGWIGDAAHQAETSGHNPDDTIGVKAEYSDADSVPEVRAIDVDSDLNSSMTMFQVVKQILDNPNNTKRLKYIIYNRVIWSRNTNWEPHEYTGSSPHVEHIHASADPLFDEDDAPWLIGDTMTADEYLAILNNPKVAARMAVLAVSYIGGPLPDGVNVLSAINKTLLATTNTLPALVAKAIEEASNDPTIPDVPPLTVEQVAAITKAVVDGVVAVVPTAEQNAKAVIAEIVS